MARPLVSVVVPTKHPGPEFRSALGLLRAQRDIDELEIVVVDSGSGADTLQWIHSQGVRVIPIPPEEFSHSGARNLGAMQACGDLLLFTVQDATPDSPLWLSRMLDALRGNDVVAVSCREEPRPDADLFYRVMSWAHTRFLSPAHQDVVLAAPAEDSPIERRRNGQLSDVACLIRAEVFKAFRYRGDYAEDLDLGLRLISAGHRLAFLTSAAILHSHNRPAYYHFRRGYVDQKALIRILPGYPSSVLGSAAAGRDILTAYRVTDALARRLSWVDRPATLRALADVAMTAFAGARRGILPHGHALDPHEYIDEASLEVVRRLSAVEVASPTSEYSGAMLHALPAFLSLVFDYMDGEGPAIDAFRLQQFTMLLYKAWAFQSGVVLAGAPSAGRGPLEEIQSQLGRNI